MSKHIIFAVIAAILLLAGFLHSLLLAIPLIAVAAVLMVGRDRLLAAEHAIASSTIFKTLADEFERVTKEVLK